VIFNLWVLPQVGNDSVLILIGVKTSHHDDGICQKGESAQNSVPNVAN